MFRYRKSRLKYKSARQDECPFCVPTDGTIIRESKQTRIVRNIFPYDLWEFRDVRDHLLIVPKRHVKSLSQLSEKEQDEIMRLIVEFEALNYNVYARSTDSVKKTIPAHQHTHLIKTADKHPSVAFYLAKPYLLLKK